MQEFFFTILIIWVLFRIFGGQSRVYHTFNFNGQRGGAPQQEKAKDGVRIERKEKTTSASGNDSAGEYVDFEEIKD